MDLYNQVLATLPQGTTYLEQLNEIGNVLLGARYIGTFASDQIPALENHQSCILNVDRRDEPGSHWIALVRGAGRDCYVYDSFGRAGINLIPDMKWELPGRIIDADQDAEQGIFEMNCGARCISFLYVFYAQGVEAALSI